MLEISVVVEYFLYASLVASSMVIMLELRKGYSYGK